MTTKEEVWCPATFYIEGLPTRCSLDVGHPGFHVASDNHPSSTDGETYTKNGAEVLFVWKDKP
jgi:hypothetical protein